MAHSLQDDETGFSSVSVLTTLLCGYLKFSPEVGGNISLKELGKLLQD
jgi:hypothetical protein